MLRLSLGQQLISMVTLKFGMALIQVRRYKDELLEDPLLTCGWPRIMREADRCQAPIFGQIFLETSTITA